MTYQYTDPEDGAVLDISEGRDSTDTFAYVTARSGSHTVMIVVRPFQRREAAAALAGPDYRVVPRDLTVGDLAQIARDAGVQLDMDLRESEPSDSQTVEQGRTVNVGWTADPDEGATVHYLATDTWITARTDDEGLLFTLQLPTKVHTREALAQLLTGQTPDRPEPVDPASVKVGDVVEIEADDGSWMVRGEVDGLNAGYGDNAAQYLIKIRLPGRFDGRNYGNVLWPNITNATVRVLHRAVPEPDEAAVEALADGLVDQYQTIQNGKWRDAARALIRDHGVHVEVPNA